MIAMHQCEFCCWYVERYGTCECPTSMKRAACEKARRMKNLLWDRELLDDTI